MGPQTAPSGYSATASVGSSRDRQAPEEAVIRIHFFLLCALVHCLSSSVQCNQVNERACNEAIRCSLVLRARLSILSWRTLAHGACAVASGQRGINSAPHFPRGRSPLTCASHGLRRLPWAWSFTKLHYFTQGLPPPAKPAGPASVGFHAEVTSYSGLMENLFSSSSPSPNLFTSLCSPPAFSPLALPLASLQHVEAIRREGAVGSGMYVLNPNQCFKAERVFTFVSKHCESFTSNLKGPLWST